MAATATARTSGTRARRRPPAQRAGAAEAGAAPRPGRRPRRRRTPTPIAGFVPVAAGAPAPSAGSPTRGIFVWLTRGRLWIGLLGALLVGIVGLNVMALSFSASSSDAGQAADELRRQNSPSAPRSPSSSRTREIQAAAAELGLVMPGAGRRSATSTPARRRCRSGR